MTIYQVTAFEDMALYDRFLPTLKQAQAYRRELIAEGLEPTDITRHNFKPTREDVCRLLTNTPSR